MNIARAHRLISKGSDANDVKRRFPVLALIAAILVLATATVSGLGLFGRLARDENSVLLSYPSIPRADCIIAKPLSCALPISILSRACGSSYKLPSACSRTLRQACLDVGLSIAVHACIVSAARYHRRLRLAASQCACWLPGSFSCPYNPAINSLQSSGAIGFRGRCIPLRHPKPDIMLLQPYHMIRLEKSLCMPI